MKTITLKGFWSYLMTTIPNTGSTSNIWTSIFGLTFGWLALTGGVAGWNHPPVMLVNFGLCWLVVLFAYKGRWHEVKPLTWPFLLLFGVAIVSTIHNGAWMTSIPHLIIWVGLIALYQAPSLPTVAIRTGAFYALVVWGCFAILSLAIGRPLDNPNVLAMSAWALFFLSFYYDKDNPKMSIVTSAPGLIIAGMVIGLSLSAGGALAFILALSWFSHTLIYIVPLIVLDALFFTDGNSLMRLDIWRQSIEQWSASMSTFVLGLGPGQLRVWVGDWGTSHAHNIFIHALVETGLIGLVALDWFLWRIWQARPWHPFIVAFAIHAMIDSPDMFLLPLVGLILVLKGDLS